MALRSGVIDGDGDAQRGWQRGSQLMQPVATDGVAGAQALTGPAALVAAAGSHTDSTVLAEFVAPAGEQLVRIAGERGKGTREFGVLFGKLDGVSP